MARPLPSAVIKAFLLRQPRCGLRRGDRICTMPWDHGGAVHYDLWAYTRFVASGRGSARELNHQPEGPPTPVDWAFMEQMTGPEPSHPAYTGPRLSPRDPKAQARPAPIRKTTSIDDLLDSLEA